MRLVIYEQTVAVFIDKVVDKFYEVEPFDVRFATRHQMIDGFVDFGVTIRNIVFRIFVAGVGCLFFGGQKDVGVSCLIETVISVFVFFIDRVQDAADFVFAVRCIESPFVVNFSESVDADCAVFTKRDAHIENRGENAFVFFHDFRVKLQVVIGDVRFADIGGIQLKFCKLFSVCGNRCNRAGFFDVYEIERSFDIEFQRFGNSERFRYRVVFQIVATDFDCQAVGICVVVCDKAQKVFAEVEIKTCVDIHCAVFFLFFLSEDSCVDCIFIVADFKVGDCKFDTESPAVFACGQIKVEEEFAHLADAAVCARFLFKAQLDCATKQR